MIKIFLWAFVAGIAKGFVDTIFHILDEQKHERLLQDVDRRVDEKLHLHGLP
jgi:hypothetical protein